MKRFVSILLAAAILAMALPAIAQEESKEVPKQKMKMYHIVLAKQGPNWKSQASEEGMDIRMGIIESVRKAAQSGLVVSAGLVNDETDVEFIFIFDLETKTEVYNLMQKAPNIKNGYFSVEAYSYFGPEGLVWQK